jgi:NAD(P)-dependent dehydrogenase (short-subunit alcohol dehydrogenase family)
MAFGLMREGHSVLAVGHIDADVADIESATAGANFPGRILPLVADLRQPGECDRIVATAQERLGTPQILVNNAGLTFTTIDPARFRRPEPQKFWQVPDDIVRRGVGPHRQCDDQARHNEPRAHFALRRL